MTPTPPAVEAIDLTKTYPGDVRAVQEVCFRVEQGEAFGLLGPNGAGKTTTIGMLNTTVRPTSGRAVLGGHDVASDPIGARAISSVVFQDPVVDRPLSGRRNLELHLRLWGMRAAEGRSRLSHLAEAVGLAPYLDRPVATYSGGERRRLEIVRALLSDPRVVFLDEPTVGLDTRVRHDLFDVLANLRDRTGVTVLLTTHYLDEAERLCDRIAILHTGRIVACDTPANLLASLGGEVLEARVDDPGAALRALTELGIHGDAILVIGGTITVSAGGGRAPAAVARLQESGAGVRSLTTRRPTLDDVYLRLTGRRIDQSPPATLPERAA